MIEATNKVSIVDAKNDETFFTNATEMAEGVDQASVLFLSFACFVKAHFISRCSRFAMGSLEISKQPFNEGFNGDLLQEAYGSLSSRVNVSVTFTTFDSNKKIVHW